jgi:hypothetical protein
VSPHDRAKQLRDQVNARIREWKARQPKRPREAEAAPWEFDDKVWLASQQPKQQRLFEEGRE